MRQVLFLLLAAMIAAFSLSWAAPVSRDQDFRIPEQVILPLFLTEDGKMDISASVVLQDSCERIESLGQELRGSKLILSIHVTHESEHLCLQQLQPEVVVQFEVSDVPVAPKDQIDIYFRQNDESLKYFGSIEVR